MVSRKGKKRALLIVGHKILCAVYHILNTHQPYQAFDIEAFEKIRNQRRIAYLQKELKDLGITA
jgi:hypothetical protein